MEIVNTNKIAYLTKDGKKAVLDAAKNISGSDTDKGVVNLSDATNDSVSNVKQGIAATPKAVATAKVEMNKVVEDAQKEINQKIEETQKEIQDKIDAVEKGTGYVMTPIISLPTENQTNVEFLPNIVANGYKNIFEDDVRKTREFELATDEKFTQNKKTRSLNADSWQLDDGDGECIPLATYYARVRDVSQNGLKSAWSYLRKFTIREAIKVTKPVLTLVGYSGSDTDFISGLTMQGSPFSIIENEVEDTHKCTTWKIAKVSEPDNPVWQSVDDTTNLTSIVVPEGTLEKSTQYIASIQYFGTEVGESEITTKTFTTSNDFGTVNAPTLTVEGGPSSVYETPTLTGGAFSNTRDPDTHKSTEWKIVTAANRSDVWSKKSEGAVTSIKVDPDILQVSTAYKAMVRYEGTKYGWSEWRETEFSTVSIFAYVDAPTLTVTGTPSTVPEDPVLTASAFTGLNTTHKSTDWKIIKTNDSSEIWKSEGNTVNKLTITVPRKTLQTNTTYKFMVRFNANEDGLSSPWTEVTGTTKLVFAFVATPTITIKGGNTNVTPYTVITGSAFKLVE